jgi:phosphatidylglycerophosphate synthase
MSRSGMAACIVGSNGIRLWGIDGAERIARQLRAAGVADVLGAGDQPSADGSVVLLRSDYLFEDRTIAALMSQSGVMVTATGPTQSAVPVAAHVPARDLAAARATLEGAPSAPAIPNVVARTPESLSTSFVRKLHKATPPVVLPVRAERVAALERHLFDGSYKGVTDLVTKWVWPAPCRAVVRVCAGLGIRPNAVTSVSFTLVVLATLLFSQGWFGTGLALAWIMTFLDTVDGKLARVTVTSTPMGHYFDHSIDSIHPPIWYIAWAWGVTGGLPEIWSWAPLLLAIVVFYIGGRFVESTFKHAVGGCSIFTWRPFDSYFRLILARRNPNLLLLTGFFLAGSPAGGLIAVAVWTVLSTVVLATRLAQGVMARNRHGALRPWIEEIGDEPGSVAAWARPFIGDLAAVRHLVH